MRLRRAFKGAIYVSGKLCGGSTEKDFLAENLQDFVFIYKTHSRLKIKYINW